MARMEAVEEAELGKEPRVRLPKGEMTLERMVLLPTWREMLMELVDQNRLDPWNIDVVDVASKYLEKIRNIETQDLRIPANLILAAAILLRFKSDALQIEEEVQQASLETYMEETGPVEIPMLELKSRIPPKRRVTLDELIDAMERVFEDSTRRETVVRQVKLPADLEIKLSSFDVQQEMALVLENVRLHTDSEGWATFSALIGGKDREGIIYTLLPLLYLAQEGEVAVVQEKFLGEIFIKLRGKNKAGA